MRRYGLPVLPLILGVILGPRLEKQLRQTLQLSAGDVSGLWSEPIAVVVYIIVALVLLWPFLFKMWRRTRPGTAAVAGGAGGPAAGGPVDAHAVAEAPAAGSPAKGSPTAEGSTPVSGGQADPAADPAGSRKDSPKVTHANHGQEKQ